MRFRGRFVAPLLMLGCSGSPPAAGPAPTPPAASTPVPAPRPASAASTPSSGLPWLGISMGEGGDLGVRVEGVIRGSPAEHGGIQVADRIVAIDGARVMTPAEISNAVARHDVGDAITVGLERTGRALRASVVLGERPTTRGMLRMHLVGSPAPPWTDVTLLSGAPDSLAALKGKVVVLDFWASWCGPCRMIAPRLSSMKDRLGAQGLAIVGITTDPPEHAAVFAEQTQMRYPTVIDEKGATSRVYNVTALPTLILIDKKGVVREVVIGYDPGRVEGIVRDLLEEP